MGGPSYLRPTLQRFWAQAFLGKPGLMLREVKQRCSNTASADDTWELPALPCTHPCAAAGVQGRRDPMGDSDQRGKKTDLSATPWTKEDPTAVGV